MTIREQYICKRNALHMTQKEFAEIARVSEETYATFEDGGYVSTTEYEAIKLNIEMYIRSFDRVKYLTTRIIEESLMLQMEDESEHAKTLSHMMIHVAKLNMVYQN